MKTKIIILSLLFMLLSLMVYGQLNLRFMTPITISPESPRVGDTITVQVTFKAQNGAATNVRVIGGIGLLAPIYDHTFPRLEMGEERTISFTWIAARYHHTAWFELDPDHTTGDIYPENNTIEESFDVSIEGVPDLIVKDFKITPDSHNPTKMFYSITFENKGQGCVSAFHWVMKSIRTKVKEGRFAAVAPACALGPGEEKTVLGFFTKRDVRTSYGVRIEDGCEDRYTSIYLSYLGVYVDDDKKVNELNERNNEFTSVPAVWFHGECVTDEYARSH